MTEKINYDKIQVKIYYDNIKLLDKEAKGLDGLYDIVKDVKKKLE